MNFQKVKKGILPIDLLSEENGVSANLGVVINNTVGIKIKAKEIEKIGGWQRL